MVGSIITVTVGVGSILLGMKGFTPEGVPLTTSKFIKGTPALVIGVLCLLFGLAVAGFGVLGLMATAGP